MAKQPLERRHIIHGGELLVYHLRRSTRARKVSISIDTDCRVVLVLPALMPELLGTRFIKKNADWALKNQETMRRYEDCVKLPRDRRSYLKHKERAREFVHKNLLKYNSHYGFDYGSVSIKNLRRNWGSCSSKSNLNFNYKICFLPTRLAEYIIVHELCHLAEFNHSKRFWSLVAQTTPDHKRIRKELHRYLL